MISPAAPIQVEEGRFARLEAIQWWDQKLVAKAKVLVIGAGALGNEVIKNLALVGIGHLAVVDLDHVELSNLTRSVLFRESDTGLSKAECATRSARDIYPQVESLALQGNVLADVGLGHFRWADVIIGALDNREARVFVNSACARVGRPWFDGGIEVLQGIVRGFHAPESACYECTMSQVDWDLLNKRRSCSLLARRALENSGTPTTPTTASIIGAMQVAEALKFLHAKTSLVGSGFVFEGLDHASYRIQYQISPDCPWHEPQATIESPARFSSQTPLCQFWDLAEKQLGRLDALDLSREIVGNLSCPSCGQVRSVFKPAEKIDAHMLRCESCKTECAPSFMHSITADSHLLRMTPAEIGLPLWDIVWARNAQAMLGMEMTGDSPWIPERRKGTHE